MIRMKSAGALLGIAGIISLASAANAITILDTFNVAQSLAIPNGTGSNPQTSNVSGSTSDIFGGTRTMLIDRVSGNRTINADIAAGRLDYSSGVGTDGFVQLSYATPSFDITPGANGLTGQLSGDLGGANFTLSIVTATGTGMATTTIPGSGSSNLFNPFSIPFSTLTGTFDLTQVTGVTLRLDGVSSFDGSLRLLQFSTPPGNVPEPGSVALLIGGAMSGAVVLRRRRK